MRLRWIFVILFLALPGYAVTPIFQEYEDPNAIYREFKNVMDNAQDKSFMQVKSTPSYTDLRDGEMMVYVSTPASELANIKLVLRVGTTLYMSTNFTIIRGR